METNIVQQEKVFIERIMKLINYYHILARRFSTYMPEIKDICYRSKNTQDERNGEFGYFISYPKIIAEIYLFMKVHSRLKFLELGAGLGVVMSVLKALLPEGMIHGYEIEDKLIKYALTDGIWKKDILQLKPEDIAGYEVIYFWEPFSLRTKALAFAKLLEEVMSKGQIILYFPAADTMGEYFTKSKNFRNITDKVKKEMGNLYLGYNLLYYYTKI